MKAKARKAPDFRICPACGTRNKEKWEYCVRCSESLADVPLGEPAGAEAAGEETADADSGRRGWVGGVTAGLAFVAVGLVLWLVLRPTIEAPPAGGGGGQVFTMPTLPASPVAVTASPPNEARALYNKGLNALGSRNAPVAVESMRRAVELEGGSGEYHAGYGKALWLADRRDEAVTEFQRAATLSDTAAAYAELAKALDAVGNVREAQRAGNDALERDPANAEALRLLSALAVRDKRWSDALPLLQRLHEVQSADVVATQDLAQALEKNGRPAEAATLYRQVLAVAPDADITRGLLAEALLAQDQKEAALDVFREGLKNRPAAPLLHRGLGSLLERTGNLAEAITEYRQYATLAPNAPDAQQLTERADRLQKKVAASQSESPS